MAKARHGEWGAFTTRGGIRFQHKNLMVAEDKVPPSARQLLKKQLGIKEENIVPPIEQPVPPKKFPRPSEEELARMRAESVQVKPELQMTPEEASLRQQVGVPDNEAPLSPDDFDDPYFPPEPPTYPQPEDAMLAKGTETYPDRTGVAAPLREPEQPVRESVDMDFLESVSVHSAPLEALIQALYDRFGIYTVYLNTLPQSDEVNPLTGLPFTKYHLGIAYQAAIQAQAKGLPAPESLRMAMESGREASANFRDSFVPIPHTVGEARRQNSFGYRTAVAGTRHQAATEIVHEIDPRTGELRAVQREIPMEQRQEGSGAPSRYNADEDEQILEPPIIGNKKIVRPNW